MVEAIFYSDRYVTLYVPNKYLDNYIKHTALSFNFGFGSQSFE